MRSFFGAVPLALVGLVIAIILAIAGSARLAMLLETRRSVAGLLIFGFGVVLAATLVPDAAAMEGVGDISATACDLSRLVPPVEDITRITEASLNVLLFVPLGIAIGLLPRTRKAATVTMVAVALPLIVEATQLAVTVLGRGCQSADVVDNLLGLAIGVVAGLLLRPMVSRYSTPVG